MTKQKSVGFIIFRTEGREIKYLMLHHEGQYWNFPKGRQEDGEDNITTARRELCEETGITDIEVIDDFTYSYDYDFESCVKGGEKEKICKHALFFLAETKDQDVTVSDEHIDFGWFDFDTAMKRAFFQEGQNALKAANEFLLKRQDFVL